MHFYQHHVGDYRRDTNSLSIMEHGVYRLLMDEYYVTQRRLPSDSTSLWLICKARSAAEKLAVARVVERFFVLDGDHLCHKRIDAEIADYSASVNNGKRGGRPPKAKPKDNLNHNLNESPPITNHEPVTKNQPESSLPAHDWPELSEVKQEAERVLAPEACAVKFFNDMQGCGWLDARQRPVVDWRPLLWNYATTWKANEARQRMGGGRPMTPKIGDRQGGVTKPF